MVVGTRLDARSEHRAFTFGLQRTDLKVAIDLVLRRLELAL